MNIQYNAVAIRISEEELINKNFIRDKFAYGKNLSDLYLKDLEEIEAIKEIDENSYKVLKSKKDMQKSLNCYLDVVCSLEDFEKYKVENREAEYIFNDVFFACNLKVPNKTIRANRIIYSRNLQVKKIEAKSIDYCINLFASILKVEDIKICENCKASRIVCKKIYANRIYSNNIHADSINCKIIYNLTNKKKASL